MFNSGSKTQRWMRLNKKSQGFLSLLDRPPGLTPQLQLQLETESQGALTLPASAMNVNKHGWVAAPLAILLSMSCSLSRIFLPVHLHSFQLLPFTLHKDRTWLNSTLNLLHRWFVNEKELGLGCWTVWGICCASVRPDSQAERAKSILYRCGNLGI